MLISRQYPTGSSPRVRGTESLAQAARTLDRFIPACAGNSGLPLSQWRNNPVHPRVCGEQKGDTPYIPTDNGSSPRVRGTDRIPLILFLLGRFIPACAGNSFGASQMRIPSAVHPRVCGEQNSIPRLIKCLAGSSPRVRGTATTTVSGRYRRRFIPACAGNSRVPSPC